MGQYHLIVNLDRGEYLFPSHLGDGLKLMEFGCGGSTMTALAVLLAVDMAVGSAICMLPRRLPQENGRAA